MNLRALKLKTQVLYSIWPFFAVLQCQRRYYKDLPCCIVRIPTTHCFGHFSDINVIATGQRFEVIINILNDEGTGTTQLIAINRLAFQYSKII